jgi:hypothetical protein
MDVGIDDHVDIERAKRRRRSVMVGSPKKCSM